MEEINEDYKLVNDFLICNNDSGEKLYLKVFLQIREYIWATTKNSLLTEDDREELLESILNISIEPQVLMKYNGKVPFYEFVKGIAWNKIREKYREKQKMLKTEISTEIIDIVDYKHYNKDPALILIDKENEQQKLRDIQKANECFERLKPDYKQIIQIKLINGVGTKQISELTGENENTIDCRYRYAIKKLRESFKKS